MPRSFAVVRTAFGPTIAVSCENTELSEYAVAAVRSIGPRYSPS